MKLVVFACLAALAVASPQFGRPFFSRPRAIPAPQRASPAITRAVRPVAILRDERQNLGDGNFNYNFESEDGISVSASGRPGSGGQTNIQGSYRFPLPEGGFAEVTYYADETGFHAQSPLLPVGPPLPQHAIDQIRFAEQNKLRRNNRF
ncbi:hypothetical protein Pmani_023843 [Petrolisthes manimaculis]|uniref:Uncharacterized protein n=1 Tax=Petrolisthes manimaculis TaxID=1843537 RepID=A0AAE1P912_9EUCA|nr:hypothetical protein Pmani_023843 [Petrolisthes manimaculis]